LTLSVPPPVFVSVILGDVVLDTKQVPAGVDDVTLVVSPEAFKATLGSLRAQFIFADTGDPVIGIPICLQSNNRGESTSVAVKTDASGLAVWEHEMPGLYDLQAFVEGYDSLFQPALVEPGGNLNLGVVKLYRSVSIQGVVVDENGQPRATGFVGYNLTRGQSPATFPLHMMLPGSNAEGHLRMNVEPARWFLIPSGEQSSKWARVGTIVDTSAGPVENIRIVLHPGVQVSLRPESDSEHPTRVTIEDASGLCLWSEFFRSSDAVTLFLARGTYTMNIVAGDQPRVSRSFTVGAEPMSIPVPR
jgi:hypothetical protein